MNNLLVIPAVFSILFSFSAVKKTADIETGQLEQFKNYDREKVGISSEAVCSGDISISGYSCVSADLTGLNVDKLTYPLDKTNDKLVTVSDDPATQTSYIYVYRQNSETAYSRISLSLNPDDYYNYDFTSDGNLDYSFQDYQLRLISTASDYTFCKYEIMGLALNYNEQRSYVVRELIDEDNKILPVAVQYFCNQNDTVQNELSYFTAEQLIIENWFRINNGLSWLNYGFLLGGLLFTIPALINVVSNDNLVCQQNMMLFNLTDSQNNLIKNNLRHVKVTYSSYQTVGYTDIYSTINANQASNFLSNMPERWTSSKNSFDSNAIVINNRVNQVISASADESDSIDIPDGFLDFKRKTYSWNALGNVSDFLETNKDVIRADKTGILEKYNYYVMLDSNLMRTVYSGWGQPFGFGVGGWEVDTPNNMPDEKGRYQVPTYFYATSLTEFWYETNGEVKKGIVISDYDKSYGAVNFIKDSSSDVFNTVFIIFLVIIGIIVLIVVFNLLGILKPVVTGVFTVLKYLFLALWWIISAPFKLIGKIFKRKKKAAAPSAPNSVQSRKKAKYKKPGK